MLGLLVARANESTDELLSELDGNHSSEARAALVKQGQSAIPAIAAALKDRNKPAVGKCRLLSIVAEIGGPDAVPPLRSALNDPACYLVAVDLLGDLGETAKPAAKDLVKLLEPPQNNLPSDVAIYPLKALAKIGDGGPEVITGITRCIERSNPDIGYAGALALTKLGEPGYEAMVTLASRYLNDSEKYKADGAVYSVFAGGVPLSKDAIPVFMKHLSDEKKGFSAARGLASVGPAAKPELIKLLDSNDDRIFWNAAEALSWMNANAQSARMYRGSKEPDPVSADETFDKIFARTKTKNGAVPFAVWAILARIDNETAKKDERVQKAMVQWVFDDLKNRPREKSK